MKVRVRRGTGNLTRWATTWSTAQPVVECFTGGDIPVWVVWVVWVRPNKLNELLSNTMRLLYLINGTTRVVECSTGGIFWKHLSCDLWQPVTECSMDGTFLKHPSYDMMKEISPAMKQTHSVFCTEHRACSDDNAIPLQTHFAAELHILLGMGGQHWGRVDGETVVQLIC